ncbi:protein PAT1 homolog 2 [Megalops cyprinoides]|uniref:protein PAT1 homolog 2 n=1 Tax=Megalops cyprinoides TaxID=118141 RepID=UPI001864B360|nr:protein PAT1 homolog 2 [Megalops cyprinoides]
MSESGQEEAECPVSHSQWPEDGDKWSEEEDGGKGEGCGLLQEMVEEDEEIDLYNEETFGLDLDMGVEETEEDPTDLLLFCGKQSPAPAAPGPPAPSSPSLSRPRPDSRAQPLTGVRGRERDKEKAGGRGKVFEDPAVMRTVEGRPSLKSLDSAIVDSGTSSSWQDMDSDAWMRSSYGGLKHPAGSILQMPMKPMMPHSPVRPQRPFAPQQPYVQSGGLHSPSSRPRPPISQPFTPKMIQLRFGAHSPSPAPVYSPSANPVQRFRIPGHVTQLHPQHRRLLSQRQQRAHRKAEPWDPHGQLMSFKEKEWIIRLQMIQLQSENPHLDDYYYQEYYQRMEVKMVEEEMLGDRAKREPPKLTTPYVTKTESYTPVVHIEGSLGQVAVSTCFSPRRAIDAVHAHCPEEQKDTRQQRLAVLHNIEKLFIVLLEVEEGEKRRATAFNDVERSRIREKMQRRVELIYRQLQHPATLEAGEEFLPCLLVSKGKRLLARLIPFLSHDAALHVLSVVTSHLSVLMSRDTDEALPVLYPPFSTIIGKLSFSQLVGVLRSFTSMLPDSKETLLSMACQNKFGISLLYALLSQGERLLSSDIPMEPSIGDFEKWTETVFQVARQLSQCSLVEPLLLPSNLLSLFCRYLDKRTVHQLENSMERSTTGFPAVPS